MVFLELVKICYNLISLTKLPFDNFQSKFMRLHKRFTACFKENPDSSFAYNFVQLC